MKKIIIFILIATSLFGVGKKLNTAIPPAKNIVIDIDPFECSAACLQNYLKQGLVFSFLAKAKESEEFKERYLSLASILNIQKEQKGFGEALVDENNLNESGFDYSKKGSYAKIALLVPQKVIGKYTLSISKSALAYLIFRNGDFDFEVFNCQDEEESSILNSLKEIKEKGYKYVIAAMTQKGAKIIALNERDLQIYIPTVNKMEASYATSPNIYFGGLDYLKQIEELSQFANDKIVYFKDMSPVSQKISYFVKELFKDKIVYEGDIESKSKNYKWMIKGNGYLNNATIFLNTPLIKTSLILSQMRYYNIRPYVVLSTQLNYHPYLLKLTQYPDRKNMLIANSVLDRDFRLTDTNSILDNDIKFNWINYSTSLGMDFFYTSFIDQTGDERVFSEMLQDNQVNYQVEILKPSVAEFIDVENTQTQASE
ncbi:MAG: hypothetical protein GXO31_07260 [Epsilonproteobacteria bacterium]|nr:hypothetical protein [Campylobacterota bacterium]